MHFQTLLLAATAALVATAQPTEQGGLVKRASGFCDQGNRCFIDNDNGFTSCPNLEECDANANTRTPCVSTGSYLYPAAAVDINFYCTSHARECIIEHDETGSEE